MNDAELSRAKTLGSLIRAARDKARRSVAECATVLGLSADDFSKVEAGRFVVSLPDLEVLAIYLDVPMSYFWGSEPLEEAAPTEFADYVTLRQRIIGVLLYQARLEAHLSVEALAAASGISGERIEAYEAGRDPIPYFELERLADQLDLSMKDLAEDSYGPLARHENGLKLHKHFQELPPDVQAFVAEPVNLNYLETAMRLSQMDVDKLRAIGEGILDITY